MAAAFGPRSGVGLSGGLGGPHYGRLTMLTPAPACRPRGVTGGEARRGVVGYGGGGAARGGRGGGEIARSPNSHTCTPPTMPAGHPTECASAAASARNHISKSLGSRARSGRLHAHVRPRCSILLNLLHRRTYDAQHQNEGRILSYGVLDSLSYGSKCLYIYLQC